MVIVDLSQQTNLIFTCLGHPYRRTIVNNVTEMDGPITTHKIAREIATRSDRALSDDDDTDPVESVRLELYHNHLPKLAEVDLIEYDPDANNVSSTSATTHLTALVQIAHSIAEVM